MSAMSIIELKCVVIPVFISIVLNIVQTQSRVFTGFEDRDNKPRRSRGFN